MEIAGEKKQKQKAVKAGEECAAQTRDVSCLVTQEVSRLFKRTFR